MRVKKETQQQQQLKWF